MIRKEGKTSQRVHPCYINIVEKGPVYDVVSTMMISYILLYKGIKKSVYFF